MGDRHLLIIGDQELIGSHLPWAGCYRKEGRSVCGTIPN